MEEFIDAYIAALEREIGICAQALERDDYVHSIYFGGGTPSVLKALHFERILDRIRKDYRLAADVEITTEANPYLLTYEYLKGLQATGIKRLSMGMQSGIESELKILGRLHRMCDVEQSMRFARQAGIDNLNLDLIFGIPTQTLATFQKSLKIALDIEPEHLSIYSLTVEEGTPLEHKIAKGDIPEPDKELSAEMYAWVMQELAQKGFEQYEISNWAKHKDLRSRHNLQYWRDGYYLGFGAGAHSHYSGKRWANVNAIPVYIERLKEEEKKSWREERPPAAEEVLSLETSDVIQETMMMGLRLVEEGIAVKDFQDRFGLDLLDVYHREIDQLINDGLLEKTVYEGKNVIRLTTRGRMLGNQVFMQFIEV